MIPFGITQTKREDRQLAVFSLVCMFERAS